MVTWYRHSKFISLVIISNRVFSTAGENSDPLVSPLLVFKHRRTNSSVNKRTSYNSDTSIFCNREEGFRSPVESPRPTHEPPIWFNIDNISLEVLCMYRTSPGTEAVCWEPSNNSQSSMTRWTSAQKLDPCDNPDQGEKKRKIQINDIN